MKKIVSVFLAFLMIFCLSSCSAFAGNGGDSSKTVSLEIVYEDETKAYTDLSISSLKIEPKFKSGYILKGFYGQKDGQGVEYLNYKGLPSNGSWNSSNPTTLYAYYEPIDEEYVYTSSKMATAEAQKYSYYYDKTVFDGCVWKVTDTGNMGYLYQIAYCNPDMEFKLTGYADMKRVGKYDYDTTFKIAIGDKTNGELNRKTISGMSEGSYSRYSISSTVTGKQITGNLGNRIGVYYRWEALRSDSYGLAKNVYFTIEPIK